MKFLLVPFLVMPFFLQQPDDGSPRFTDFAVARERVAHPVKMKLMDAKSRAYATKLREFEHRPPNLQGIFSWLRGVVERRV